MFYTGLRLNEVTEMIEKGIILASKAIQMSKDELVKNLNKLMENPTPIIILRPSTWIPHRTRFTFT